MVNRYINMAFGALISQLLKDKVRAGSIRAVKAYIVTIKGVRMGLLGLFGLGALASVLVTGLVLSIVGIVGLLPITATAQAVTILVIGVLLTLVGAIASALIFSQRRWLELSRSYEMMDAVLAPWPDGLPPNPLAVVKGEGPKPTDMGSTKMGTVSQERASTFEQRPPATYPGEPHPILS